MSVRQNVARGVKWVSLAQVGRQLVQIGTFLVLANLIAPEDFGIVNTVNIVVGFVSIFNEMGTSAALIQRKELTEDLISSVFWLNLLFSLVVILALVLTAPLVAWFYDAPAITPLLRVLSITFLITALSFTQKALLERDMVFNRVAQVEIFSTVLGAMVGIGAALAGAGAWSLIWQTIVTATAGSIGIWFSSPWRPRRVYKWAEIKNIYSFSLGLTGFSIFNYLARNADNILIGKFLGLKALGYYAIAYRIMLYPLDNISRVVNRVMFPVFSRYQDDDPAFRQVYLKVVSVIALASFPLMIGLASVSSLFVQAVMSAKWQPVIILIWILAPVGIGQSITTTVGNIYLAKGYAHWLFAWGLLGGLFFMASFMVGLLGGVVGVALAYAAAYALQLYPSLAIPFRLIDLKLIDLGRALARPALNSILMFAAVVLLQKVTVPYFSSAVVLILCVITGVVVYGGASLLSNSGSLREVISLVRLKQTG